MNSKQYGRLRAVACRYWSCAPPQFDQWADEGRISMVDVLELVIMLSHDPVTALWLWDYIDPEAVAREETKKKAEADAAKKDRLERERKITMIRMINGCVPKNEEDAAQLKALKDALSR